ncbi:hypothetical protein E4U55_001625 [Claviceps digitariae]|nr:hypothetical protein E4U55_001625 [Claviceps digitariae]
MLKAYKNLTPKTRLGLGAGLMAWALAGMYLTDQAEQKFGYTPSEQDKEDLWKWVPRVTVVERGEETERK